MVAVVDVVQLSKSNSEDVKRRCAAALDALSCHPSVQARLVKEEVVKSLMALVSTVDKAALMESPHLSLPALLNPPPKLVPTPKIVDALPPLPPRGDNFDDSVSNRMLNHAFSRSAKNLLSSHDSNWAAAVGEDDSALALPAEYYDADGNFNLKDFPRALQANWSRDDVQHAPLESAQEWEGAQGASPLAASDEAEPVTLAHHISKQATAAQRDDDSKWRFAYQRFASDRIEWMSKRPIEDVDGDGDGEVGPLVRVARRCSDGVAVRTA